MAGWQLEVRAFRHTTSRRLCQVGSGSLRQETRAPDNLHFACLTHQLHQHLALDELQNDPAPSLAAEQDCFFPREHSEAARFIRLPRAFFGPGNGRWLVSGKRVPEGMPR